MQQCLVSLKVQSVNQQIIVFQNKASECRSETNNPGNIGNLSNATVNTKKRDYNRNDTKAKKQMLLVHYDHLDHADEALFAQWSNGNVTPTNLSMF